MLQHNPDLSHLMLKGRKPKKETNKNKNKNKKTSGGFNVRIDKGKEIQ
jgi:hypothetical protein